MAMKFDIGDKVRVVQDGYGCGAGELGKILTITNRRINMFNGLSGYVVNPPIGNCLSGMFGGYILEPAFEKFVSPDITQYEGSKIKYNFLRKDKK